MRTARIFTRRRNGLDNRVWLVILVTWLLCLGLLGYRKINDKPCPPAELLVNQKSDRAQVLSYPDKIIFFQLNSPLPEPVTWDFDDGSGKASGKVVTHIYKKEGIYNVVATLGGHCTFEQEVRIKIPIRNEADKIDVQILGLPFAPKAGSEVTFFAEPSSVISTYEWKLLNSGMPVRNDSIWTYRFDKPGTYTVQLIINRDPSTLVTKEIHVTAVLPNPAEVPVDPGSTVALPSTPLVKQEEPAAPSNQQQSVPSTVPPQKKPEADTTTTTNTAKEPEPARPAVSEKPKPIAIDEKTFQDMLQEVIDGNKDLEELYPYLDYGKSTKVEVNGKPPLLILPRFCDDMKNRKKNKIESLQFKRDDHNSIQTLKVKLPEKKGLLDKINPFKKS